MDELGHSTASVVGVDQDPDHHWSRPPGRRRPAGHRTGDVLRMVWWTERGFLRGIRHGRGAGRALRGHVLPQLLAAADTHRVPIETTAATAALAAQSVEVPSLVDVGRGAVRGRRLRRPPA